MLVAGRGAFGTFHAAGSSDTTWHGFAEAIFSALQARGLPRPKNLPISTADYPTPAKRPQNSRLSSARFAEAFGITLRGYAEAMPSVLDEALSALPAGATR
jgi:dTDP-4-dehydrorhamnose reductase